MPFIGEVGRPGGKLGGLEPLFNTREHPPITGAMPSAANWTRRAGDSLDSDMFSNGFDGEAGLVPETVGLLGMIVVGFEDSAHPTGSRLSPMLFCHFGC